MCTIGSRPVDSRAMGEANGQYCTYWIRRALAESMGCCHKCGGLALSRVTAWDDEYNRDAVTSSTTESRPYCVDIIICFASAKPLTSPPNLNCCKIKKHLNRNSRSQYSGSNCSASSEDIQWWLHQIEARLSLFDWSPVLAWSIDWTHALYQGNSNATKVRAILLNILMIFLASLPARFVSPQTASWAIRCALIDAATTWYRHRLYNIMLNQIRSVYRLYPPIELKSKMITIETGTACPRRPRHSMEGALHCPLCFWRSLPNSLLN